MQVRSITKEERRDPEAARPQHTLHIVGGRRATPERLPAPTELPPGYSGIADHSTPFHSFIEHSMFFTFPFLFVAVLYFSTARLYELDLLWLIAIGLPLSLVIGDFVTGVVHWAADTYGTDETPIIGQSLVRPFRLHHTYPKDICTHNVVTTLGNSCILGVPLLTLCLFFLWDEETPWWLAFTTFVTAMMSLVTVATNQFHKWAHQDEPTLFARWLQRAHVVLTPSNHQTHHTDPYDNYYCITNGWLNPLLNKVKFFRGLEAGLRWLGIRPTGRKV